MTLRLSYLLALAAALALAAPSAAQGTDPDTVSYSLGPPSDFEYGCFGPCACAVFSQSPLTGTFTLRFWKTDPLYTWYQVVDVRFEVPDATHRVMITGSGFYRRGGEVAVMDEMALDLSFDGGPIQHFGYAGLQSPEVPFPEIRKRLSIHPWLCTDSVVVVDAKPSGGVSGVGGDPMRPSLAAAPNPFGASTEIRCALAEPGRVSLGVFDLGGRRLRTLAEGRWLEGGPHAWRWDGRTDEGSVAPAGLYFVRLHGPSGDLTRAVVKLR